jgi:type I restriction enzyme R subunit
MTQPVLTANQSNFVFLREYDPLFLQLAQSAERAFSADPNTTLIKLRQFAEAIAQEVAARSGVVFDEQTTHADLLYKLNRELFHILRIEPTKVQSYFDIYVAPWE